MRDNWKPELDESDFCEVAGNRLYIQLVGILLWIVRLGRVDIAFVISPFSRFSALPRKTHLDELEKIIGFLEKYPDKRLVVNSQPQTFPGRLLSKSRETMQALYPDAEEEIDPQFPRPMGRPIQTSCWFDSNLAHDQVTRRSIEGYMLYVGSTLVKSKSSRQGAIAASTYGSELRAGRTATEEALGVRYLLRSLGINLDGPTILLGDNESSLISVMNP